MTRLCINIIKQTPVFIVHVNIMEYKALTWSGFVVLKCAHTSNQDTRGAVYDTLKLRFYRFLKSEFRVVIRFLNKPFL